MDFGWPNAEIGRKMANSQLLFLALIHVPHSGLLWIHSNIMPTIESRPGYYVQFQFLQIKIITCTVIFE